MRPFDIWLIKQLEAYRFFRSFKRDTRGVGRPAIWWLIQVFDVRVANNGIDQSARTWIEGTKRVPVVHSHYDARPVRLRSGEIISYARPHLAGPLELKAFAWKEQDHQWHEIEPADIDSLQLLYLATK